MNMPANSVIKEPPAGLMPGSDLIVYMASVADDISPWGNRPALRDRQLREFWPTEPILASAIYSTASRYAAFGWHLDGPDRMVNIVTKILNNVEFGQGWIQLMMKVLIDLFTQDNGAFIEVIRQSDSPTSPVIGLSHLDANKCTRTGRRLEPVVYYDREGQPHIMKWYQVIPLTEFPSPIEKMYGMQYCAVTRMLRAAQILRDISIYKREKISGRFVRALHLVSGVQKKTIDDALKSRSALDDNAGFTRYVQPLIIASLDPTATVNVATLELASLPDGFDEESNMKWYINQLALAFGSDYQDFAPLPGGNLGTAQQSQTLHLKSRGRASLLFMTMIEQAFNFHGIMPPTVKFEFGDQDLDEDISNARVRQMRAQERKLRIESGELSPEVARLLAVETGDLDDDYIPMLEKFDNEKEAKRQEVLNSTTSNDTKKFTPKQEDPDKSETKGDKYPSDMDK